MSIFAPGQHDACPRGCGELEDQCACPSPAARKAAEDAYEAEWLAAQWDTYDDAPLPCRGRWAGRPCTDEATRHGLCDLHLDKD